MGGGAVRQGADFSSGGFGDVLGDGKGGFA